VSAPALIYPMKYSVTTLVFALAGLASAQSYVYFTFAPPGASATTVTGMNNAGQIVGSYTDAKGTHNFLRSVEGSTYTTINLTGAAPGTTTIGAINNVGQIAGTYTEASTGLGRCYLGSADGSTFTPFDLPDFGPAFGPHGLNDNGEVSGAIVEVSASSAYGFVRLRGELSKVTRHASGHIYLTIKDDKAAIDGVIWKGRSLQCRPEQGLEVIVTGKVTTYPASSKYQLVIDSMEPAGVGALLAQLERLKAKLAAEGLFDPARKRPLPAMPATIGVITSPTGAVIRDILHRIRERWPCRVVVWPVVVQGEAAAAQVAGAIAGFNALSAGGSIPRPDVLIVARGGGSVEDLWPFNDEGLARAAAASAIPLISAVGHEIDFSIADFVADLRAATPSAAAEIITEGVFASREFVADAPQLLSQIARRKVDRESERLDSLMIRFSRLHPRRRPRPLPPATLAP